MRYPAVKQHPLAERLEEARWCNYTGSQWRAAKMLDDICRDLEKSEEELEQENKPSPARSYQDYGHYDDHGIWVQPERSRNPGKRRSPSKSVEYVENERAWDDWRKHRDRDFSGGRTPYLK